LKIETSVGCFRGECQTATDCGACHEPVAEALAIELHHGVGIKGCILIEINTTGITICVVITNTEMEGEPTVLEGETLRGNPTPCMFLLREIAAIEL
jgi:hypothetical protein